MDANTMTGTVSTGPQVRTLAAHLARRAGSLPHQRRARSPER